MDILEWLKRLNRYFARRWYCVVPLPLISSTAQQQNQKREKRKLNRVEQQQQHTSEGMFLLLLLLLFISFYCIFFWGGEGLFSFSILSFFFLLQIFFFFWMFVTSAVIWACLSFVRFRFHICLFHFIRLLNAPMSSCTAALATACWTFCGTAIPEPRLRMGRHQN